MDKITPEYLAAGANRHPSAADWDESGLLAYGTDRNIALWYPGVSFDMSLMKIWIMEIYNWSYNAYREKVLMMSRMKLPEAFSNS